MLSVPVLQTIECDLSVVCAARTRLWRHHLRGYMTTLHGPHAKGRKSREQHHMLA